MSKKVWLITGANSGFGKAFAEAAIANGDFVVAAARRPDALAELVAAHPGHVEAVQLDVTDQAAGRAVVDAVVTRHGRIDVLVNNAGRAHVGAAEETTDAELRDLFEVHFFGPAELVRAALPHMRAQGAGAIVQVSSMGGQMSFAGFSAYSATKFALEGFTEALADEVAALGIKVLIVEPGAFRTGLFGSASASTASDSYQGSVGTTRNMVSDAHGSQPGDPAKAAAAVIAALDAEHTPLRLPLGADALDAIVGHLDTVRADISTWEKTIRDTAFDES